MLIVFSPSLPRIAPFFLADEVLASDSLHIRPSGTVGFISAGDDRAAQGFTRQPRNPRICRIEREHFVMTRKDGAHADLFAQLGCFYGIQITRHRSLGRARIVDCQEGHVLLVLSKSLYHAVIEERVTAVINRAWSTTKSGPHYS